MGPLGVAWAESLSSAGLSSQLPSCLGAGWAASLSCRNSPGDRVCRDTGRSQSHLLAGTDPSGPYVPGHPNTKWGLCAKNDTGNVQIPNVYFPWAVGGQVSVTGALRFAPCTAFPVLGEREAATPGSLREEPPSLGPSPASFDNSQHKSQTQPPPGSQREAGEYQALPPSRSSAPRLAAVPAHSSRPQGLGPRSEAPTAP
ncbi:hypothetical protein PAL_GLEAN10010949 [Pteropus alecto]|uniref:Uncharacterized protein n=1 Tax=Pteropus alecto TaxID=9402 RepID=L5KWI3_PTEAL|nr:hypothetical protein PAL_GLEAN10010949 [Pteropus alecto]